MKVLLVNCAAPLFENAVVVEVLKHRFNRGNRSNLSFFRDSRCLECDLLFETGRGLGAIDIKSGASIPSDWFDTLNRVAGLLPRVSGKGVSTAVHDGRHEATAQ